MSKFQFEGQGCIDKHMNKKFDTMRRFCNMTTTSAYSLFLRLDLSYCVPKIQIHTGGWLETVASF
jgi:hypothetical protein